MENSRTKRDRGKVENVRVKFHVDGCMYRVELYFEINRIAKEEKVDTVSGVFGGEDFELVPVVGISDGSGGVAGFSSSTSGTISFSFIRKYL